MGGVKSFRIDDLLTHVNTEEPEKKENQIEVGRESRKPSAPSGKANGKSNDGKVSASQPFSKTSKSSPTDTKTDNGHNPRFEEQLQHQRSLSRPYWAYPGVSMMYPIGPVSHSPIALGPEIGVKNPSYGGLLAYQLESSRLKQPGSMFGTIADSNMHSLLPGIQGFPGGMSPTMDFMAYPSLMGQLGVSVSHPAVSAFHDKRQFIADRLHYPLFPLSHPLYPATCKRKGGQIRFNNSQTAQLEKAFAHQKYLNANDRKKLAQSLGLSDRQVKTWFQNRRAKLRKCKGICAESEVSNSPQDSQAGSPPSDEDARNDSPLDMQVC